MGSVPLADAETVFRTVAAKLGAHLERIPDGETGERTSWIAWQYGVLAKTPGLEPVPVGDRGYLRKQLVRLRLFDRRTPRFGSLGYADAAIRSFAIFDRLQREGSIPAAVRFQVSLPTPLAPMTVFVEPNDRALVEPAYEAQLLREVERIAEAVPHDKLAIQWDVAAEFGHLEGLWPAHFDDIERGVVERLLRIGKAVPRDVELGYHLCYGDFGHRHFVDPSDATTLVRIANALSRIERPLAWLHVPVPIAWTERASFAPLARLSLRKETKLHLGVIHVADGIAGARKRIARAAEVAPHFGVATECGWGRRPPESVSSLLDLHAELAEPVR